MALHIAGDMLNLQSLFLGKIDHSITALIPTTIALILRQEIRELLDEYPLVAMRLWHETFIDGVCRAATDARQPFTRDCARLAHLICEFAARMRAAGLSNGETFDFPLTQHELGDALGLSTVHINRTVKKLNEDGLISWHLHSLTIQNSERLKQAADFDDAYLKL